MNVVLILAFLKAVTPTRRFRDSGINSRRIEESINFGSGFENKDDLRQRDIDDDRFDQREVDQVNEFLRKGGDSQGKTQSQRVKVPHIFLSPRDELSYDERMNITKQIGNKRRNDEYIKSIVRPVGFEFSTILDRNLEHPPVKTAQKDFKIQDSPVEPKRAFPGSSQRNITEFFEDNSFARRRNASALVWTTCDVFAKKAVFHPDDIVNTRWIPFYVWAKRVVVKPVVHTFSYPTKKTVQYYKTTFGPYIKDINWNRAKLLLKDDREILLVAKDGRGLFGGILNQELSLYVIRNNVTIPTITLRLKIHDPYLAMMYCEENYAVIMAESGTQPTSGRDAEQEASTLQFRGKGIAVILEEDEDTLFDKSERDRKLEEQVRMFKKRSKSTGVVDRAV